MPAFGEPRSGATQILAHVQTRVTDLMAGTAAEAASSATVKAQSMPISHSQPRKPRH
jgi:hypothetical protein